ncbi:MAG: hypothetical protein MZU95_17395 [Desulfomicrobium escambiense]|nr:hypothetical protein [Desulfomicrobium escambiense]
MSKDTLPANPIKKSLSAIKDLTVRGAPAIGVAAAMGAALGALHLPALSPKEFRQKFFAICDEIAQVPSHGSQSLLGAGAHEKML